MTSALLIAAEDPGDAAATITAPAEGQVSAIAEDGASPRQPAPPLEPPRSSEDRLSFLDPDFKLGRWTFHGYVQYDAAAYDQAPEGPPSGDFRRGGVHFGDPLRARNLSDGSHLRRARLGWEGSRGERIAYRAMFELGANEPGQSPVAEVWVSYSRAPYSIKVGAYSPPTNMEGETSSDSTLFLERATAADLARSLGGGDGRIGVTVTRSDAKSMVALSLTGPQIDDEEGYIPRAAILARYTRNLRWREDYRLHFGINGAYVLAPANGRDEQRQAFFPMRLLSTPEIDVDDTPLIDTGEIDAEHSGVIGLEFAAQRKNLYLQAEAFWFGMQRHGEEPGDPNFAGFYVQGSWILTGEARRFDRSRAAFWFPTPNRKLGAGGLGAWELALRYSVMDLNYRAGSPEEFAPEGGVRGGRQEIWGAALLWYPRPRVRVMLNYLHVNVDRLNPADLNDPEPFGTPPSTPPVGVQIGQTFDVVGVRLRYSF